MKVKYNIKGYTRIVLKKILRTVLNLTAFVPTSPQKILFFAGLRGYTCNPKYICEYLNKYHPGEYQLCWIGNDSREIEGRKYIKFIKCSPFSLLYALMTSRVFVTNGTNSICPKSKNRLIVGTMHGVPFKKFGFEVKEKFSLIDISNSAIDLFVSNSDFFTENCIHRSFHYHGRILNCGFPRNDILLNKEKSAVVANKVKDYYKLSGKIVLFAPTYRGDYQTAEKIDFRIDFYRLAKAMKERFGNDISIIIRMHYFDKNQYEIPDFVVDVGNWYDMQEILCTADILITDYSSTIWDFALTLRPCLFYAPDLERYIATRGLPSNPETWPGKLCMDMDELCNAINNIDEVAYAEKALKYFRNVGSYENGHATEAVCKEIIEFCRIKQ